MCENCFSCEKCFTGQEVGSGCEHCFSCEKCFTGQDNCEKCFTCERCYKSQSGSQPGQQKYGITYFLFPTNNCNLRCKYCYATKTEPEMDEKIFQATLNFLFNLESQRIPNREIHVQFFGGEPTMRWDLLTRFVEEGNKLAAQKGMLEPRWGMTTNATLLNEERMKWLKAHKIGPLFSIDGRPETHDKYRVTVGGEGSFKRIPFELIKKYFPGSEIRPTIMPDTVGNWFEDLKWFHSHGFYAVATEVAYEADWTEEAMEVARKTYNKMGDYYIDHYFRRKKGEDVPKLWMKFIDDGKNFLGARSQCGGICGTGRNTVAINAKGYLFACQRYASFADSEIALGDVWKGFDAEKLKWWNDMKREYMYPDPKGPFKCETCPALWKCRGGCNAMNYQVCGDRNIVLQNHCKFQRLWAEITLRVLAATGELWEKLKVPETCTTR